MNILTDSHSRYEFLQFVGLSGMRLKSFELFKTLAMNSRTRKIVCDLYQIPNRAFLGIVTESLSIRRPFGAFVATLSSFVGNREIKPSNKTKEKLVEGFSIRLITPSRTCEQSKKLKQIRQILKPNQDQSVAPSW